MTGGKENSKSGSDRFEHEYYIFPNIYEFELLNFNESICLKNYCSSRQRKTNTKFTTTSFLWKSTKLCLTNSKNLSKAMHAKFGWHFFLLDLTNIFHIHEVFYWFARWFFINNSIVFLDIYLIIAIIRNENTSPTIWKKNIYL